MGKINGLNEHLVNMIKAGEVVDGPFSVVKELVENAIDAEATVIDISLTESGINKIVVSDNGCGMDESDALMAFIPHHTSKIKTEHDLFRIQSLGFRGEAIPSIASVSQMTVVTKTMSSDALRVVYKAGKFVSKETTSGNCGTAITVGNLFYNTPARLKHLKTPQAILITITDLFDKFCLCNPHIRFTLWNNGVMIKSSSGSKDIKELFGSVYGLEAAKNLCTFHYELPGVVFSGGYVTPYITRSRRNVLTLDINGRFFVNQNIEKAILRAFSDYIPENRYPIIYFKIELDPLLVDCNIHPQKREVKFSNEDYLVANLTAKLIDSLSNKQSIPAVKQYTFPKTIMNNETSSFEETTIFEYNDNVVVNDKVSTFPYLEYIGCFAGTYLLFQNDSGMYLIDQHAAMERINYEKHLDILSNPPRDSRALLFPYEITLTKGEAIDLASKLDILSNYGFQIDAIGETSFALREIPTWVDPDNYSNVCMMIIEHMLAEGEFDLIKLRKPVAEIVSCKASIKANHTQSLDEVNTLISNLKECNNPYNCPHGRPTIISLTHYEIEKRFKRVV